MFWVEQLKRFFVYSCVCLINISGFLTSKVLIELSKQEFLSLKRHYLSLHLGCFHYVISLLCGCVSAREKPAVHCPALKCFHSNLFFFFGLFFSLFCGAGIDFYVCPLTSCYLSCYCHKLQTYFVNYFYECCYLDLRSSQPHI